MADTTTPFGLINLSLKMAGVLGVGQNASADDIGDSFAMLQMMLSQWQQQRWLVYHLVDVPLVSTGAATYSVGPGGDFNVTRPAMIEAAFFRQLFNAGNQPVDYPFTLIPSREDYNKIALKSLGTYPAYLWYDASYPFGTLHLYPIPAAGQFEIHLTVKDTLQGLTDLRQVIQLPPEYKAAIFWNLASQLREMYQLPPSMKVEGMARATLSTIRAANAQIPILNAPDLPGGDSGWFNPFSGQWQ